MKMGHLAGDKFYYNSAAMSVVLRKEDCLQVRKFAVLVPNGRYKPYDLAERLREEARQK